MCAANCARARLAEVHEGQEADLAEPLEEPLGVGVDGPERSLPAGPAELRRAVREHDRVPALVVGVAQVEGAARRRGGEVGGRQEVDHAALLGVREAVEHARRVAGEAPGQRGEKQRIEVHGAPILGRDGIRSGPPRAAFLANVSLVSQDGGDSGPRPHRSGQSVHPHFGPSDNGAGKYRPVPTFPPAPIPTNLP